jgi:hypothetical protein
VLRNTSSKAVTVSGVALSGADPGDFLISSLFEDCIHGITIQPGWGCLIRVNFHPLAVGPRSASLVISSPAATAGYYTVYLTGTGQAGVPKLRLNTLSLDFGPTRVGSTTVAQYVVVFSTGTAPVVVNGAVLGGADPGDFDVSDYQGTCSKGMTLDPGKRCILRVHFSPTATGSRDATLAVSDNVIGSPQTVAVHGTGTPDHKRR